MPYVYLLLSLKDKKHYIGSTVDLYKRMNLHHKGQVQSTKYRRPLILKGFQEFMTINEAAIYEKKYKKSHDSLNRAIKRGDFVIIIKLNEG